MATHEPRWSSESELPIAQVVRPGRGQTRRRPSGIRARASRRLRTITPHARGVMMHVIGFWPLIAIAGLAVGLLWSAGMQEP